MYGRVTPIYSKKLTFVVCRRSSVLHACINYTEKKMLLHELGNSPAFSCLPLSLFSPHLPSSTLFLSLFFRPSLPPPKHPQTNDPLCIQRGGTQVHGSDCLQWCHNLHGVSLTYMYMARATPAYLLLGNWAARLLSPTHSFQIQLIVLLCNWAVRLINCLFDFLSRLSIGTTITKCSLQ